MKYLISVLFSAAILSLPLSASVCPATVNTNTDCGYLITIGAGGAVSGASVNGASPYDGNDDALVGIVNNSGAAYSGSIYLSGSSAIFGFDGDGICTFISAAYCSTAQTGYEGPLTTFANISADATSGDLVVSGLAAGASTYFSLEGAPSALGITTVGGSAPEPASLTLIGAGLAAAALLRRKRKQTI